MADVRHVLLQLGIVDQPDGGFHLLSDLAPQLDLPRLADEDQLPLARCGVDRATDEAEPADAGCNRG